MKIHEMFVNFSKFLVAATSLNVKGEKDGRAVKSEQITNKATKT